MKRNTTKTNKSSLHTRKISSYFTKLPTTTTKCKKSLLQVENNKEDDFEHEQQSPDITLDSIHNSGSSKLQDFCQITPEKGKRKYQEGSPSPDFIPSSLDAKDAKFKGLSRQADKRFCRTENQLFEHRLNQVQIGINSNSASQSSPPKKITKNEVKTPRKSPRKSFCKSPHSLQKFNVEVLENFVKRLSGPTELHMQKAIETQRSNENTPTKILQSPDVISPTQQDKVRIRLNFSPAIENKNNRDCLNDSWENEWCAQVEELHLLDLKQLTRCKIITIEKYKDKIKLFLQSMKNEESGCCIVEDFWCTMRMEVGDVLCVNAVYNNNLSAWHVTNDYGLLIYEPDTLISCTTVVGARFCMRRSVLTEHYRGFEPSNNVMIIGILVHQIFQDVLVKNLSNESNIRDMVKQIMLKRDTIRMLYESGLETSAVLKELETFIPRIIGFMKDYVSKCNGTKSGNAKENWKGKIDTVQDIEENIWCPELGLKGKVDASVISKGATYPLEVKAGKATASIEHRGQVMLYIMMMKQLGYKVPSGLLLYLRDNTLREILINHVEKRDLILLRNELTYYLTKKPDANKFGTELPEPINHHNACSKCPYNIICCSYLRHENTQLQNNPLSLVQEKVLSHLSSQHIEYFVKWSLLLRLEGTSHDGCKQLQEIYTIPPEKREEKGRSLVQLNIKNVEENEDIFNHTFEKLNCKTISNLQACGLSIGEYVVVSTDIRPAVSSGIITYIDHSILSVNLDRDLKKRYPNSKFHLDTYNSSISQTFNMTSVALLLEASSQAAKLRSIIIDKKLPTFQGRLPKAVATKGIAVLRSLNKSQQKAVLKALSSNDYLLIKGMPGTGKTATIVALIQILVDLNKTVLITSHTHSAVDNVCVRLKQCGINLLRLGSDSKINSKLHCCSEKILTQHCTTVEQLEQVYNSAQVVAVTCLGSGHSILNKRLFDVCIVDESTQILQCSVIRALHSSHKFILIGDPDQLPPIVRNQDALLQGLSESLFERLDMPSATVSLIYNYRMNKPITDLANSLTYKGELLIANDDISQATLHIPQLNSLNDSWILNVLDSDILSAIKILDTGPIWMHLLQQSVLETNLEAIKCSNRYEARLVLTLVEALRKGGVPSNSIGIIAPYRAQVSLISSVINNKEVDVSTVDQYQGRDKEVIIYSCTKSTEHLSLDIQHEILEDQRRLTVAITRAKHKFILIGDLDTVKRYSPFAKLLSCLQQSCFIRLQDNEHGFNWDAVMN